MILSNSLTPDDLTHYIYFKSNRTFIFKRHFRDSEEDFLSLLLSCFSFTIITYLYVIVIETGHYIAICVQSVMLLLVSSLFGQKHNNR